MTTRGCLTGSLVILPLSALLAVVGFPAVRACGPNFPNFLLEDADRSALVAPEARFDDELERMHLVTTAHRAQPTPNHPQQTLETELADLRAALQKSGMPQPECEDIIGRHSAERQKIVPIPVSDPGVSADKSPFAPGDAFVLWPDPARISRLESVSPQVVAGLPGEFADYFRGSIAWHRGDVPTARNDWLALLRRPALERPFKSTWAAFMLGKSWEEDDRAQAIAYFRSVRELAGQGFADSSGLAAASLGWEARLHWRDGRFTEATDLYLEQAAAGDRIAYLSLRFVGSEALNRGNEVLKPMARHPRAQRVVTAYVISGGFRKPPIDIDGPVKDAAIRILEKASAKVPGLPTPTPAWHHFREPVLLWLDAVEKAGVIDVDSADQLALAAYQAGQMEVARRWLDRAPRTAAARWLQAKLLLRDGKVDEAAALLASVARLFPVEPPMSSRTNAPSKSRLIDNLYVNAGQFLDYQTVSVAEQTRAETGLFQLSRRQYTEALDALLHSSPDYWMDAAYVAERVLKLDELQVYVDRHWPAVATQAKLKTQDRDTGSPARDTTTSERIRYLLGRRLARLHRFDEARVYFPENLLPVYDQLAAGWRDSRKTDSPMAGRAGNLLQAAQVTRQYGLELIGTEVEPDWRIHEGNFQEGVTVAARERMQSSNHLAAATEEIERAHSHGVEPDVRWHYRQQAAVLAWEAGQLLRDAPGSGQSPMERAAALFAAAKFTHDHDIGLMHARRTSATNRMTSPTPAVATSSDVLWQGGFTSAALAWEAARLIPDNSDETARILCMGGTWIKVVDPQAADLLYKALVRRCRRTAIGAEADRLRWFPRLDGDGLLFKTSKSVPSGATQETNAPANPPAEDP